LSLIKRFDDDLKGRPDQFLTWGLIIGAVIIIMVALRGDRVLKAVVLAWIVLP